MIHLVAGQNVPWPELRVTAYLDHPAASVCALLLGAGYRVRSSQDLVDPQRPSRSGVDWLTGPQQGITVDLTRVDADVERILCLASTASPQPATLRLLAASGEVVADFSPAIPVGSAVALAEIYRNNGGWKVRAVGQSYAAGMDQACAAHGLQRAAAAPETDSAGQSAGQAAGQAAGRSYEDLLRQNRMILDDASRTTASLRSTRDFASSRWEADLEQIVADPSLRLGPRGDASRQAAQDRHDAMVREAEDRHRRDLDQLMTEIGSLEGELPAPLARWDSRAWRGWQPPGRFEAGVRVGELSLPEDPRFAMPFLLSLPLGRPLWIEIDSSDEMATEILRTAATRHLAASAVALTRVSIIDIGGRRGSLGLPDVLLQAQPATDSAAANAVLTELLEHLDLLGVALSSGSLEALDDRHQADRLLLITDFPTGLDESTLRQLLTVIEEGPRLGVAVLVTGTHAQSLDIALLEWLHQRFLRVPSTPGGDLVDGFGGVEWTFLPDVAPAEVLADVVARLAASRTDPYSLRRRT